MQLQKLRFLGVGILLGAIFALCVAGLLMASGMSLQVGVTVWAEIMGGPIFGTGMGMCADWFFLRLGWLGLLLIPAHPVRPHWSTGLHSAAGLVLWFWSGFLTVVVGVGSF